MRREGNGQVGRGKGEGKGGKVRRFIRLLWDDKGSIKGFNASIGYSCPCQVSEVMK